MDKIVKKNGNQIKINKTQSFQNQNRRRKALQNIYGIWKTS